MGTGSNTPDGGRLFCLERATGDTVWSAGPDVEAVTRAFGPEIVGAASFSCSRFEAADIDGDGDNELVVRFVHGLYYPCCICLIDRDGNLISQYANKGHLTDFLVEDLDSDGKAEVLAWGTNNASDYQGFTVVQLDDEHWSGASIDSLCSPASSEEDGAAIRLVVPAYPAPYMKRMEQVRMQASQLRAFHDTEGNLRYNVRVGGRNPHFVEVTLNEHLRPLSARATDTFQANMAATWPDSLVNGTGPADEGWLSTWLGTGRRFEAGQRVRNR